MPRLAHLLPALPESMSLALGDAVAASEAHAVPGSTNIIGASSSQAHLGWGRKVWLFPLPLPCFPSSMRWVCSENLLCH